MCRAFFFERCEALFGRATILMSAVAFAFLHLLYENVVAVVLTLAGGLLFSITYARSRSLRLVWLEHSLYGILVLTIGLGEFFHSPRFA